MKTVMKKEEEVIEEKPTEQTLSTPSNNGGVNTSSQASSSFVVPAPTPAPFVLSSPFFTAATSKFSLQSAYAKDRTANRSPTLTPPISPTAFPTNQSSLPTQSLANSAPDTAPSVVLSPPSPRSPATIEAMDEERITEEEENFLKSCGWSDAESTEWLTEEEIREFQSRSQQKVEDLSRLRDLRKVEYDQSIKEWYEKRSSQPKALATGAQDDTDSETEAEVEAE
jgi:hypothetical protein